MEPTFQQWEAHHTLLTVLPRDAVNVMARSGFVDMGTGTQNIRFQGTIVQVLTCTVGDMNCYYVKLKDCSLPLANVTRVAGANLCGNLRHYFSIDGFNYYDQLEKLTLGNEDSFKYVYKLDKVKEKITQEHHLHVRLRDLYKNVEKVALTGNEAILAMYLDKFNKVESTHATFITYIRSAPKYAVKMLINLIRLDGCISMNMLKLEGTKCKQMQHYAKQDLAVMFELAVLVNRLDTEVDWKAEKTNRVTPNVVDINSCDIKKHCTTLFRLAKAEGKKPLKMSWLDYWQQRAIMMPAGAVHSQIGYEKSAISTMPREIKNKKGLASMYKDCDQSIFLERPREIHSYTSTKYEWGKVRALYGCDFTTHVNADYGLLQCEDTFPHFVPTGSAATEVNVSRVLKQIDNKVPFCYDFDDFNSQHSTRSMQAVIQAWIDVYHEDLTDEQILAAYWTLDSVHKQYVHNGLTKEEYQTSGTLFSGWRLTTFVNTALNYAYLACAGINENCGMSVHNGDDVYAGLDNLQQAVTLISRSKKLGIRANVTKMSLGTIAEFLRIDMRASEKTASQYLTRGVSTFVHSRVESDAPLKARSLVQSYKVRFEEVCARGGDRRALKPLFRKQIFFARKLFGIDEETMRMLMETALVAGGLACNDYGIIGDYKLVDNDLERPREGVGDDEIKHKLYNGITSYTTYLCRVFPSLKHNIRRQNVYKKTLAMYNLTRSSVKVECASRQDIITERALTNAWSKDSGVSVINKIRMGVDNILLAVLSISNAKANALDKVEDPIKWLSVLI